MIQKILLLILILTLTAMAQHPVMSKRLNGTVTITGTGVDSIFVQVPSDAEITENSIPWRGAHGVYIVPTQTSGSTPGNTTISYKKGNWLDASESPDVAPDTLASVWAVTSTRFRVFDVAQDIPIFGVMLYISRTSGDGVMQYEVYSSRIRYR